MSAMAEATPTGQKRGSGDSCNENLREYVYKSRRKRERFLKDINILPDILQPGGQRRDRENEQTTEESMCIIPWLGEMKMKYYSNC